VSAASNARHVHFKAARPPAHIVIRVGRVSVLVRVMVQESAAAEAAAAAAHAGAARERPTSRWDRSSNNGVDSHRLSVAPMMDCTDTHFRQLCRMLSRRVHLWTEMVNQDAVLYSHKAGAYTRALLSST